MSVRDGAADRVVEPFTFLTYHAVFRYSGLPTGMLKLAGVADPARGLPGGLASARPLHRGDSRAGPRREAGGGHAPPAQPHAHLSHRPRHHPARRRAHGAGRGHPVQRALPASARTRAPSRDGDARRLLAALPDLRREAAVAGRRRHHRGPDGPGLSACSSCRPTTPSMSSRAFSASAGDSGAERAAGRLLQHRARAQAARPFSSPRSTGGKATRAISSGSTRCWPRTAGSVEFGRAQSAIFYRDWKGLPR